MIEFFVPGIPQQQGSKSPFVVNGRAVMCDSNAKKLNPWRKIVAQFCRQEFKGPVNSEAAFSLCVEFTYEWRKTDKKRIKWKTTKPDLDKLERAICDALTGIVWADDSQVCMIASCKVYGDHGGARIKIEEVKA